MAVETWFTKLAVDTKFVRLAVETKFNKLGVEIKDSIEEANSLGSIKLLIYVSRPAVVESRFWVEIRFRRLAVDTKFVRFAVETKLVKLAVETTPVILETYPDVPNPLTVDAS